MENNNVLMPQKHHMESSGDSGPSTLRSKCSLSDIEGANPKQFLLSMPFGHVGSIHRPAWPFLILQDIYAKYPPT